MRLQSRRSLVRDQRGLSTVEYTVLLVLIVACAVGLWQNLGDSLKTKLTESNAAYDTVKVEP